MASRAHYGPTARRRGLLLLGVLCRRPVDSPRYPAPTHSARYRAEMDRRRRVSSNAAKHERKAREEAAIERFDQWEVYERDHWLCGICGQEVDPEVLDPDATSASLDHVVPLSRGGDHTRDNSVLAHLICNIRKSVNRDHAYVRPLAGKRSGQSGRRRPATPARAREPRHVRIRETRGQQGWGPDAGITGQGARRCPTWGVGD
ncbi:HNH endonuclease [Plantibacter cousiniae (nom. nud.)]|uniref:HNH endonuclease n=1 Tax=Plantibacter cousiniae (nom. nud.) TaxID=199709 RepID=UPI00338E3F84